MEAGRGRPWADALFAPVSAGTLCVYRALFYANVAAQAVQWRSEFRKFRVSALLLPYPATGWVPPPPPAVGDALVAVLAIAATCASVGLRTRAAAAVVLVCFTYVFVLCESNHNNHYILVSYLSLCGCVVDWGVWLSVDAWLAWRGGRRTQRPPPTVPYWHLLLMQLMMTLPYTYGGVAKFNRDWLLRAQPVTYWFSRRDGLPYTIPGFPWFICWGGFLFDSSIGFLLFWKRTRYIVAFPACVFFNISNNFMFNIGIFPYVMLSSLVLFVSEDAPVVLWRDVAQEMKLGQRPRAARAAADGGEDDGAKQRRLPQPSPARRRVTLALLAVWVGFHALWPLRTHLEYDHNPSWSEEGHLGAWHMMLRTKHGWATIVAKDADGGVTYIDPAKDPYLLPRQLKKITSRPHAFILYVAHLRRLLAAAGTPPASMYVENCYTLNERPPQLLYDHDANLVDYVGTYESLLGGSAVGKWIVPLHIGPPDEIPPRLSCSLDPDARPRRGPGQTLLNRAGMRALYERAGYSIDRRSKNAVLLAPNGETAYMWREGLRPQVASRRSSTS